MASAELNLGHLERAQQLLSAVQEDMKRLTVALDWYWRMPLESALAELWLAKGDLAQARPQAEMFLKMTLATAERTWQALAWEVNARVAMAEGNLTRVHECIAQGLATMEGYEVPLAHWRVHATASELHSRLGKRDLAEHHRTLSCTTIMKLANSLPVEEPLRQTFLSSPMIRKILGDPETEAPRARRA